MGVTSNTGIRRQSATAASPAVVTGVRRQAILSALPPVALTGVRLQTAAATSAAIITGLRRQALVSTPKNSGGITGSFVAAWQSGMGGGTL